jgi:hypothetical protein
VTGYAKILVSTVPGSVQNEGEFDPTGYANVLDTPCRKMMIRYVGGHTGLSYSETANVNAGTLTIVNQRMMPPDKPILKTVGSWGQSAGYYVTPGETVVLHDITLSILSITCTS